MKEFKINSLVKWNWGNGTATGTIKELYTGPVSKHIDGSEITREASAENPAYLIIQDDGQYVLKSHSELETKN